MGMRMGGGSGGANAGRAAAASGPKKPLKPETLKRVARTFQPYLAQIVLIVVCVLISAALGVATPYFLRIIIDRGLLLRDLNVVTVYSGLTVLVTLAATVFSLGYGYLSVIVGQKILRDLRARLFGHLQGMPLRFFTATRTGEIQSRLTNDFTSVSGVLSDTVASVLFSVATVLSSLVGMFLFDWRLTLLSVGSMPLFAFIASKVGDYAGKIRKEAAEQNANITATMQETLSVSGVLLTKTTGRQELTTRRFGKDNEALAATSVRMTMVMRVFFNLIRLAFSLTPIFVYWLAGYLVVGLRDTNLTIGTIVGFTALQTQLLFPLTQLLSVQADVTSSLSLFERIFEYLDLPQEITDAPDALTLNPDTVRGSVRFENVTFFYEQEASLPEREPSERKEKGVRPTLQNITLDARPGQLIALVGASGAGKTTLTYLIPRLYDADQGRVLIDDVDIKQIKLQSLGQVIGVVTQETYLVHDTIRENLRYGRPEASDAELIEAAKAAAIHDHVASLPEGYDTVVGERGYKLSGGEKQRIAIARAILKNPKILILDEATSALDTQSERLIQGALERLSTGRTTFAIAHRLSTILAADQILVMQRGEIIERGTHPELLEQDGAYARLYAAQFRDHEEDPLPLRLPLLEENLA
ncbi:MAG: ABC transporter ATP-binding protein [Cytophagales bacterium]|nr:ABC transporter ATP-binding protein [Armatimonadota bacterium]